ncbi:MAG: hypothetical protein FWC57_02750 [Endomicrobia bacterium]|nr:hypothetical protein [Endomicrobiia bacterium]
MKKTKAVLLSAVLLFSAQSAFARRAPTQPNTYDGFAPTARSMAMGNTGVGMINNASAFYNAANLGFMSGTHAEASVVITEQSKASPSEVALADPAGQGLNSAVLIKDTSAIMWRALSNNSISVVNSGGWQKTDTYINAFTVAAGQKNDNGFCMGINLTYLYGKIGESSVINSQPYSNVASGNGFTCDFSFAYPAAQNLYAGINLQNIAGFMFWNDYNVEQLPFTVRAGAAYMVSGFAFAFDYSKYFYRFGDMNDGTYNMGIEQYVTQFLCVRGGIISDQDFTQDSLIYTYGLGFRIKTYEISFAGQQFKVNDKSSLKYMLSFSASVY